MIGALFSWLLLGRGVGGSLADTDRFHPPGGGNPLFSLDVNQLCAFFS